MGWTNPIISVSGIGPQIWFTDTKYRPVGFWITSILKFLSYLIFKTSVLAQGDQKSAIFGRKKPFSMAEITRNLLQPLRICVPGVALCLQNPRVLTMIFESSIQQYYTFATRRRYTYVNVWNSTVHTNTKYTLFLGPVNLDFTIFWWLTLSRPLYN